MQSSYQHTKCSDIKWRKQSLVIVYLKKILRLSKLNMNQQCNMDTKRVNASLGCINIIIAFRSKEKCSIIFHLDQILSEIQCPVLGATI